MKNTRKQALFLLIVLNAVNKRYGKLYCYPSQLTIMALLAGYQDVKIAIATVNRWLRDSEDNRFITRTRRIKRDKRRGIMFKSTLYKITLQGYHVLAAAGVNVWKIMEQVRAEGLKAGHYGLSKHKGPVSLKTILAAPMIFGVRDKTYLLEE